MTTIISLCGSRRHGFNGMLLRAAVEMAQPGTSIGDAWHGQFEEYRQQYPTLADHLDRIQRRRLPDAWDAGLPVFPPDPKGVAGRDASAQVLNAVAKNVPWLIGGSADLAPSTKTRLTFEGAGDFGPEAPAGRNFPFGVREHAMAAVLNGLSLAKVRPFGSGFLIFSDYARPAIRLAALMELPVIHIFTHDSIGVGEDGPTHQPVEHLASLRAIPGLITIVRRTPTRSSRRGGSSWRCTTSRRRSSCRDRRFPRWTAPSTRRRPRSPRVRTCWRTPAWGSRRCCSSQAAARYRWPSTRTRVPGYRQEPDVARGSTTDTYVALRLWVDNSRWADVPFYLQTGKRLPQRLTEVVLQFKRAPLQLFRGTPVESMPPNQLVLCIQPNEGISLQFEAKVPGPRVRLGTVRMDFSYADYFGIRPTTGYETLLYNAMIGDSTLFHRADIVEAGWTVVEPILQAWEASRGRISTYAAGTWGPEAADALMAQDGREWRRPAGGA